MENGRDYSWVIRLMASSPFMANRRGKMETMTAFLFLGSKITVDSDCRHEIKRYLLLGGNTVTKLDSTLKDRDHFSDKGPRSQSYGFSSSHVQMWKMDHKEGWGPKNWCFWIVVLEKTPGSPLGSKEIKPVNPEGNQLWILIGSTDAEAEAPILWVSDAKSWLTGKRPWCWQRLKAGGEGGGEEKAEDEMVT